MIYPHTGLALAFEADLAKKRRNRLRSIRTPEKASRLSRGQRATRNWGPTVFALAKKAHAINAIIVTGPDGLPMLPRHGETAAHDALAFYRATGFLSPQEWQAGEEYNRLRHAVFGPPAGSGTIYKRLVSGSVDESTRFQPDETEIPRIEELRQKDHRRYLSASWLLKTRLTVQQQRTFQAIVVESQWPTTWLEVLRLRRALRVLAAHWRREAAA